MRRYGYNPAVKEFPPVLWANRPSPSECKDGDEFKAIDYDFSKAYFYGGVWHMCEWQQIHHDMAIVDVTNTLIEQTVKSVIIPVGMWLVGDVITPISYHRKLGGTSNYKMRIRIGSTGSIADPLGYELATTGGSNNNLILGNNHGGFLLTDNTTVDYIINGNVYTTITIPDVTLNPVIISAGVELSNIADTVRTRQYQAIIY